MCVRVFVSCMYLYLPLGIYICNNNIIIIIIMNGKQNKTVKREAGRREEEEVSARIGRRRAADVHLYARTRERTKRARRGGTENGEIGGWIQAPAPMRRILNGAPRVCFLRGHS